MSNLTGVAIGPYVYIETVRRKQKYSEGFELSGDGVLIRADLIQSIDFIEGLAVIRYLDGQDVRTADTVEDRTVLALAITKALKWGKD